MNSNVHYNLDKIDPELRKLAEDGKLTGPCFIGQGLTTGAGSDCYPHYIVAEHKYELRRNGKTVKVKTVYGIASGMTKFEYSWTDGYQICFIDIDNATPDNWITKYGKSWYFCDVNGNRYKGAKCRYGWNGAYGYQDPSF